MDLGNGDWLYNWSDRWFSDGLERFGTWLRHIRLGCLKHWLIAYGDWDAIFNLFHCNRSTIIPILERLREQHLRLVLLAKAII